MILRQSFFRRPVLKVAPELLGKFLVRRYRGREIAGMITEVEAYDGPNDFASHASRGMTERNKIMFGEAGYFYVYLCYGMHWMLNIVTGEEGYPAAVLIRGVFILDQGGPSTSLREYRRVSGPGKVTKFLKIDNKLNGKAAMPENGLWFENRGIIVPKSKIERTSRIGVHYAKEWAEKPYRFRIKN
ncbi:MAG: DNA-3-methyladenine glycosylase, partial [Patescibacteria group bacterium]